MTIKTSWFGCLKQAKHPRQDYKVHMQINIPHTTRTSFPCIKQSATEQQQDANYQEESSERKFTKETEGFGVWMHSDLSSWQTTTTPQNSYNEGFIWRRKKKKKKNQGKNQYCSPQFIVGMMQSQEEPGRLQALNSVLTTDKWEQRQQSCSSHSWTTVCPHPAAPAEGSRAAGGSCWEVAEQSCSSPSPRPCGTGSTARCSELRQLMKFQRFRRYAID